MSEIPEGYKRTEAGMVPDDWEVKPLHLLAEKIMVGIASAATHAYRDRGVVMFRNQNIKPGYLDDSDLLYIAEDYEATFRNKRLKGGDLLTARTGYPGTTSIVPPQYEGAQSFTTLITRPRRGLVDSEYLCAFINSEEGQRFFEQNQIGGGQKNVNAGSLKNLPVAFPPTTGEQESIAKTLSDADALIESLEQLLAKKRHLKQGTMQDLLTGKKRLPGFSGACSLRKLSDMATLSKAGLNPAATPEILFTHFSLPAFDDGAYPVVELGGQIGSNKFLVPAGAVLLSKLNPRIPRVWAPPYIPDNAVCSTEFLVLVPRESTNREFLAALCQSPAVCYQMELHAIGTTGSHQRIHPAQALAIEVYVPTDKAEQTAIAVALSDMDAEIATLETELAKTRTLKQGMMQKLLTGEIRLL